MLARDAAVYMARWWRTECMGDAIATADQWIVEHWDECSPRSKPRGITDVAHVRAAVRRAKQTWLNDAEFILSDGWRMTQESFGVIDLTRVQFFRRDGLDVDFAKDACVIVAVERTLHQRSKCLFWTRGMLEVRHGKLVPVEAPAAVGEGPSHADRQGFAPVAAAIATFVGLSRSREIVRLRAPASSMLKQ